MKKAIFVFLCLMQLNNSFAQDGCFLQPDAGAGLTNIRHTQYDGRVKSDNNIFGFDAGLLAGYHSGRWTYTTGLEYLKTGSKQAITLTDALGDPIGTTYIAYRYSHVLLPVTAGYSFYLGKRLTFTPAVGAGICYNISESDKYEMNNYTMHISSTAFNNYYHRFSCFGLAQAELAYRLSKSVSITCAPTFDYMLTNMRKQGYFVYNTSVQHNYALLLDFGVRWQPAKKKHTANENTPAAK